MRHTWKLLTVTVLMGHALLSQHTSAQAQQAQPAASFAKPVVQFETTGMKETVLYVDGTPVTTPFFIDQNHQMVPVVFFRAFGIHVGWDYKYRSAVVSNGQVVIGLPAGKKYTDYMIGLSSVWHRDYLKTTTALVENRAYVPLAYTARKLGWEVTYDKQSKTTYINTAAKDQGLEQKPQAAGVASQAIDAAGLLAKTSEDDLYWLYQITEAEAGGESYKGKVAVAASILNRVESNIWPNSIQDTIFQVTYGADGTAYYQYSPVLDKRIYQVTPSEDTIKAVHEALNGEDPSLGATVFYNPDKTDNQWVRNRETYVKIGNHVFAE